MRTKWNPGDLVRVGKPEYWKAPIALWATAKGMNTIWVKQDAIIMLLSKRPHYGHHRISWYALYDNKIYEVYQEDFMEKLNK